jgi:hypothetical protein
MPNVVDELRERNRATWSAGEWDEVAELVREVGPRLLVSSTRRSSARW